MRRTFRLLFYINKQKIKANGCTPIMGRITLDSKISRYGNTQHLIARHHDTDHPHLHLILNRVDTDGKGISDQSERIRSTQVCKELIIKHGLYFAGGKENVKRHRLREPDKVKYEIYDVLKSAVPKANCWQELAAILEKEGIGMEFKAKGETSQIEGVKFKQGVYSFFGLQD